MTKDDTFTLGAFASDFIAKTKKDNYDNFDTNRRER